MVAAPKPTISDTLKPAVARLKTSRPSSSVPIRWVRSGGAMLGPTLIRPGSKRRNIGASMASANSATSMKAATTDPRLRLKMRHQVGPAGMCVIAMRALPVDHTRIDQRINHVGEDVGADHHDGQHKKSPISTG